MVRPAVSKFRRRLRADWQLYLLVLPCLVFMVIFRYIPMNGIIMAFQDYNITRGITGSSFIGFAHFADMFGNDLFLRALRNTIWIKLLNYAVGLPAPLLTAVVINEVGLKPYRKTMQSITYFPYFLSWIVINGILMSLFSTQNGIVNEALKLLGREPYPFMMSKSSFVWVLVFSNLWKNLGSDTIIYLAALTAIDPGLYEAARIDGANKWRQIRNITLPGLKTTFVVLLILSMGRILKAGDEQIIALYSEPVYEVADVIGTYVYRTGIGMMRYGYTAAVGMFQSVIGLIMVLFTNRLSKRYNQTSVW